MTPAGVVPRLSGYEGTFEQRETQKLAWLESLFEVLTAVSTFVASQEVLREKYQVNGEQIFAQIDSHGLGHVTAGTFARWVQQNCFFGLSEQDLVVLTPVFDPRGQYRFGKADFVAAVSAPELKEEEE